MMRITVKVLTFAIVVLFVGSLLDSAGLGEPPSTTPPSPKVLSLTLDQAKSMALDNNKQLQLARINLDEKEYVKRAARSDYFPKLLGAAYYLHFNEDLGTVLATRDRTLGGATIGRNGRIQIPTLNIQGRTISANVINQDTAIGTLLAVQPITKLIAVSAAVDLAQADQNIASAQLDEGTREVLSGVTQCYYGIIAARRIKAALAAQTEALAPLLKAQPTPELRLGALEVRKGLAETDKQLADLVDLLNQLLGLPPCTVVELAEPALHPIGIACEDEAAQRAVINNPKIIEAEQNIMKARAGLRVARLDYVPDVYVFGLGATQSAADYIQPEFAAVGVSAAYTFVDWGKRKNVKFQRETQIALAVQNVEVVAETVRADARKAFTAYKQAEEELAIAGEVVKANADAAKEAKGLPAIMTAQAAVAKAQLDLLQAEVNYKIAHAKLQAAIGHP
jgi:outer membrane protein TolC